MMKKIERNEFRLCWILADHRQRVLFIPKMVKANASNLMCGEASLYFKYKNQYPDFAEVII